MLKKLSAYLLWQQYSKESSFYELPNNLCRTFWLTIIAILIIPFTWPGLIFNHIKCWNPWSNVEGTCFEQLGRSELYSLSEKMHAGISLIFFLFVSIFGLAGLAFIENNLGVDVNNLIDTLNITTLYFLWQAIGILTGLFLIICIIIIVGIMFLIGSFYKECKNWISWKKKSKLHDKKPHEKSKFKENCKDLYGAFMNKYCTKMDWNFKQKNS